MREIQNKEVWRHAWDSNPAMEVLKTGRRNCEPLPVSVLPLVGSGTAQIGAVGTTEHTSNAGIPAKIEMPVRSKLRKNNHCTLHPQIVMKSAYIGVDPRTCKGHAESRNAKRGLREPDAVLR